MALEALFSQLLLKIQDRITAQVPEVAWKDQELGQLDWYDTRPAVQFPCVLIDFPNTNYDQMQSNQQWGNLMFSLRLAFAPFASANAAAPQSAKEYALTHYEIEHKLFKAFQGWDADGLIQQATRVNTVTERRQGDNFRVRNMVFTTSFMDDAAVMPYNLQIVPLNLTMQ